MRTLKLVLVFFSRHVKVRSELDRCWPSGTEPSEVVVTHVDDIQGAEFHIVLLATTRSTPSGVRNVSLNQPCRVNVALTRAKQHLFVFGNCTALENSSLWAEILNFPGTANEKQMYTDRSIKDAIREAAQRPERVHHKQNQSGKEPTWNYKFTREVENGKKMSEEARSRRIAKMGFLPAFDADMTRDIATWGKLARDSRAFSNSLSDDSD
jgi:superfamily I DNA and/or RNA helicase